MKKSFNMKKNVLIICICVIVVVIAVIAVLLFGRNSKPPMTVGTDELVIDKKDDNAVIMDFDTGSIIQTPVSKTEDSSASILESSDVQSADSSAISSEEVSSQISSAETSSKVSGSSETSSVDPNKDTMSGFNPWQ